MHPAFLPASAPALPIELVHSAEFDAWLGRQTERVKAAATALGFKADAGKFIVLTDAEGRLERVLLGLGEGKDAFVLAALPTALPPGDYRLAATPPGLAPDVLALGWADGAYRFTRYKANAEAKRRLALPSGVDEVEVSAQAKAIDFVRDLVNTPAADMSPDDIAKAAQALAVEFGATIDIVAGETLANDYPMVHAVGRGAQTAPCFIELAWRAPEAGPNAPKLAIVGKGVAFDSGGLNLKGGANMALMKKDMGGAAHALGLARLVMERGLAVDLRLAIPAVENAIGPASFRPGDILRSRKGLTVEIEDTDAEGRLILADALARVCENGPDLIIDFATLTGAARVALGPDLAPLYTDDDALAADVMRAALSSSDPVWRMPLWPGYEAGLSSPIADLKNLGDGGMAGSITAALFLKKFVTAKSWAHFDIWAWRPARYGRPAGAAACGLRAVWTMLKTRYGLAAD